MTKALTIGAWTFDHVSFDREADVLYLSIGPPRRAVGEETPEGHVVLTDEETGEFCGLTIIGVQRIVSGEMSNDVTVPSSETISSQELDELVCA
jgi:uncharacterized protein YuzE